MKRGIKLLFLLFVLVLLNPLKELTAQTIPMRVRFGYYAYNLEGKYYSSALSSMKSWIESIQMHSGHKLFANSIVDAKIYSSENDLYSEIYNKTVQVMNLTSWDYLRLNLKEYLTPLLVSSLMPDSKFEKYCLIVHSDSGIHDLNGLSSFVVEIPKTNSSKLIRSWLTVELIEILGRNKYGSVHLEDTSRDENQSILSVFFKKNDAAVVREGAYLIAGELNPQIRKKTSVIASSPNLINYFLAVQNDMNRQYCKEVTDESLNLPLTIEGKQILSLMKTEKIYELNEDDFHDTEKLFNRFNKLFK